MRRYTVIFSRYIDAQILYHFQFIANVSLPAAKRFRNDFGKIIKRIEENPFQFPIDDQFQFDGVSYRKALFGTWYKALFTIEGNAVYLDYVIDCRQE
jgi:hypothetical protein